jgi:hypothetical protein
MTQPHAPHHEPTRLSIPALVLGWLLPGAGHLFLGQVRRAILICVGVLGLFFSGLFVGGIDVVDSGLVVSNTFRKVTGSKSPQLVTPDGDAIWFVGQAFTGPVALVVDVVHQHRFKVIDPAEPRILRSARPGEGRDPATGFAIAGTPPATKSLARVNEVGTLFCTLAGLLNLIAMIDAGWNHRPRRGEPGYAGGAT